MAKIIEKIVVDDSQHSEKLKKAKSELRSYAASQQSTGSIIKGVTAVVGKFAVGLGVATTATAALSKVLGSSQTTADNMQAAMSAASATVETFANALATCDMSAFTNGLGSVVSKALEAARAVDQLGNTMISYNFFKSGISADLADQMVILRDKNATPEQKDQAKKAAQELIDKEAELVTNMSTQIMDTVRKTIASEGKGVLNAGQIGMSDIQKVYAVDAFGNISMNHERLDARYNEWRMKEAQRSQQGNTSYGTRQELISEYRDAILGHMMLENMTDEQLQNIANMIQQSNNERRSLAADRKALNRAMSGVDTPTVKTPTVKTPKVTVPKPEPLVEGSLAWYQDKLNKANKDLQNAATDEARYAASKVVEELQNQIARMKQTITFTDVNKEFMEIAGKDAKLPGLGSEPAAMQIKELKKIEVAYENMGTTAVEQMDAVGYAMERMGRAVGGNAGEWLAWAGNLASAISSAIPMITALTTAKKAQAAAEGKEAATGAASAVANIPVVGPAMAVAAVASIIAALMSIPKFANGAIAYGPTLGLFGEYSGAANNPEVVAPLDRLRSLIGEPAGMGGQVEFHIQGKELYGILNKQNRTNSRNA